MSNLVDWQEPVNCPKCGCGWALRINEKGLILIFCSNPNCTFAWQSKAKTLLDAVKLWNRLCEDHEGKDRPNTPLLVQIYNKGKESVFRTKTLTDKAK